MFIVWYIFILYININKLYGVFIYIFYVYVYIKYSITFYSMVPYLITVSFLSTLFINLLYTFGPLYSQVLYAWSLTNHELAF